MAWQIATFEGYTADDITDQVNAFIATLSGTFTIGSLTLGATATAPMYQQVTYDDSAEETSTGDSSYGTPDTTSTTTDTSTATLDTTTAIMGTAGATSTLTTGTSTSTSTSSEDTTSSKFGFGGTSGAISLSDEEDEDVEEEGEFSTISSEGSGTASLSDLDGDHLGVNTTGFYALVAGYCYYLDPLTVTFDEHGVLTGDLTFLPAETWWSAADEYAPDYVINAGGLIEDESDFPTWSDADGYIPLSEEIFYIGTSLASYPFVPGYTTEQVASMDTESPMNALGHHPAGGWAFTAQRYSFDPPGHLATSMAPEYGDFVEESSTDWVADCTYRGEDINLLEEQFDIGTLADDTLSDNMAALTSALVAAIGNIGKPVFNFQKTKTRPLKTNQLSLLAAEDVTETNISVAAAYTGTQILDPETAAATSIAQAAATVYDFAAPGTAPEGLLSDVTETEEGGLSGKPDFSSALPWIT